MNRYSHVTMASCIFEFLRDQSEPVTLQQIREAVTGYSNYSHDVTLNKMKRQGIVIQLGRDRWTLPKPGTLTFQNGTGVDKQ